MGLSLFLLLLPVEFWCFSVALVFPGSSFNNNWCLDGSTMLPGEGSNPTVDKEGLLNRAGNGVFSPKGLMCAAVGNMQACTGRPRSGILLVPHCLPYHICWGVLKVSDASVEKCFLNTQHNYIKILFIHLLFWQHNLLIFTLWYLHSRNKSPIVLYPLFCLVNKQRFFMSRSHDCS